MRNIQTFILYLIFTLTLAVLLPGETARASTFEVKNTNNSGAGSLRPAITNANINVGADIIIFNAATNGIPIVLAGISGENANGHGDLDILAKGDLTILGNSVANTTIDGGGFGTNVTLKGVTIRNGRVAGGHGGGIYNNGNTTVDACTLSANKATYGSMRSAGLYFFQPISDSLRPLMAQPGEGEHGSLMRCFIHRTYS